MSRIYEVQPRIIIQQMENAMGAAERYVMRCAETELNHDAMLAHIHQQLSLIRALNKCLDRPVLQLADEDY